MEEKPPDDGRRLAFTKGVTILCAQVVAVWSAIALIKRIDRGSRGK